MLNLRALSQWPSAKKGTRDRQYFIDLSSKSTSEEISSEVSNVLRSTLWQESISTNLDSLMEYVWAFFEESWGNEVFVHVKFPPRIVDPLLIVKLAAVFFSAHKNATASRLEKGDVTVENIRKAKVFFYT